MKRLLLAVLTTFAMTATTGCVGTVDDEDDEDGGDEEVVEASSALADDWHLRRAFVGASSKPKKIRGSFVWGFHNAVVKAGCENEAGQSVTPGAISIVASFEWIKKRSAKLASVEIVYAPQGGAVTGGIGTAVGAGGSGRTELVDFGKNYRSDARPQAKRFRVRVNEVMSFEPNRPILVEKIFAPVEQGVPPQVYEYCFLQAALQIFPKK